MRRLVALSALVTLVGLLLLLPSSQLYSLLAQAQAPAQTNQLVRFAATGSATVTGSAAESVVGIGLVAAGILLEVFSLFTDVGGVQPGAARKDDEGEEGQS